MYLFTIPILAILLLLTIGVLFKRQPPTNSTAIKPYPIVGNLPHLIRNLHRCIEWSSALLMSSPTSTVTVAPIVFTANPTVIEHILKTKFSSYPKSGFGVEAVRDIFGHGVISTNGDEWLLQRKAATFEFTTRSIRAFVHTIVCDKLTNGLLPLLQQASKCQQVLDLQEMLERFAFDNMRSLAFGQDFDSLNHGETEEGSKLFRAFDEGPHISAMRATEPLPVWKLKRWLCVGSERRLKECIHIIDSFVEKRLDSAKQNIGKGHDLLSRLAASDENSNNFIRDMVVNFVVAGRDTTPCALTWLFWLLFSNPISVNKIREEVKQIRSRQREQEELVWFSLEELREMNYLHAAICEALRLYPPVPLIPRDCTEAEVLPDGTRVEKGWIVMYNAFYMGRREELWGKDCMEFKPERWLKDGVVFEPKSSFLFPAFLGGPRMCVGKEMAFIQMKAVAANIVERFDVEVVEKRGSCLLSLVMKMEGGLPVRLKRREIGV